MLASRSIDEPDDSGPFIFCPYCNAEVRRGADSCPHCTFALPSKMKKTGSLRKLFTCCFVILGLGAAWFFPIKIFFDYFESQRTTASQDRQKCKNNLDQIGWGLHLYYEAYDSFPPPFIADENGKPMHSWRVLILPYLDEKPLYDAYDFTKSWDTPENRHVLEQMPEIFRCPSDEEATADTTNYVGVFGDGCMFDPARPVRFRDIKDGMSNTMMVGEVVDLNIPWTKPQDVDIARHLRINQSGGFGSRHEDGCQFLFAEGSVRFFSETVKPEMLNNLFRRDDGNMIDEY